MRRSLRHEVMDHRNSSMFGVDFHQFIEKEHMRSNYELAEEFGVTLETIKRLKHQIRR
ncbi:RNA polymerase subunit sigma-70 [Pseudalkalibacillus decolorationis]|uniref:RNA polymerase subunit sigma-70 n=1 Tax=Pseudalkalibacillus decolorationis TaxID=163879 RepID=UPI002147C15B|nr:RNA polymerase subunit sigma-70 [Pseudalkalibacillus decolorationis]